MLKALISMSFQVTVLLSTGDAPRAVQAMDQPIPQEPDHAQVPTQGLFVGVETVERSREVSGIAEKR